MPNADVSIVMRAVCRLAAVAAWCIPLCSQPLRAQEPEKPTSTPSTQTRPAEPTESAEPTSRPNRPGRAPRPRRARRPKITAMRVGTLHPGDGKDAIQDAMVLLADGNIAAFGSADQVVVPQGVPVVSHPDAHAYPGLVEAMTDAFGREITTTGEVDAGTPLWLGLNPQDKRSRRLARAGVTTAYVGNRSTAVWRGLGTLIRPTKDSFRVMSVSEKKANDKTDEDAGQALRAEAIESLGAAAALGMKRTTGPRNSHALFRHQSLAKIGKAEIKALKPYEKAFSKYSERLEDYDEKFEAWLTWHRKKSGKKDAGKTEKKNSDAGAAKKTGPSKKEKPAAKTGKPKPSQQKPSGKDKNGDTKKGKEPARPKWPKPPVADPAKEALIRVRDGELTLRVEARRTDEIEMALEWITDAALAKPVLMHATGANTAIAEAIAAAGVPAVITDIEPSPSSPYTEGEPFDGKLASRLAAAGVTFALAGGTLDRSCNLPLLAAQAVGTGLDPATALRAITIDAARILGVDDRVGSIAAGKYGDFVLTDGPLFASDTRVIKVLSRGKTIFEAKKQ